MKKLYKVIFLLIINIVIFLVVLFILDIIVYKTFSKQEENKLPFHYYLKNPGIALVDNLEDYYTGESDTDAGRLPNGIEYKDKEPIIIFGDSFAHGMFLKYNQTFSYKLSNQLKRPVYNRAICGAGLQHMYYQVSKPFEKTFFSQVPKSDTVFYIMIDDHWRRMTVFSDFVVSRGISFYLRYSLKNNKLNMDNYDNIFLNLLKSSYTIRYLQLKYIDWWIYDKSSEENLTDLALRYFIATRENLEQKWNNKINFIVILYDDNPISHKETLKTKLKENGFTVIDTSEITNEILHSSEYMIVENEHPNENAWDLLTPKIIKAANL